MFLTPYSGVFSNTKTLKLDGSTKYIDLGNNYDVSTKAQLFSISGWFYPTNASTNFQGLFDKQNPNSPFQGYTVLWTTGSAGKIRFQLGTTTGKLYDVQTTNTFSLNAWHFFAATWNGTAIAIYVDSNSAQSLATNTNNIDSASCSTTQPTRIGYSQSGGAHFSGNINQFTFWNNYTLTTTDVSNLYGGGHPPNLQPYSASSWWEINQLDNPTTIGDRKDSVNGSGASLVASDFVTSNPSPP